MKFRMTYMNKLHSVDLPVTAEQLDNWQKNRMTAAEAMPNLTQTQLDFLTHGIYPDDSFFDSIEELNDV
jgi:Holliday junction resolvase RusA-like endonuclease